MFRNKKRIASDLLCVIDRSLGLILEIEPYTSVFPYLLELSNLIQYPILNLGNEKNFVSKEISIIQNSGIIVFR